MSCITIQVYLEGLYDPLKLCTLMINVYNSHVAYIMRRFRRVCAAVGSKFLSIV